MLFCVQLKNNLASVPIIQRVMVNYLVIWLKTITLDPYYLMLINHQVQDKIYPLRVMVQSFGTGPITVSLFIGGYVTL